MHEQEETEKRLLKSKVIISNQKKKQKRKQSSNESSPKEINNHGFTWNKMVAAANILGVWMGSCLHLESWQSKSFITALSEGHSSLINFSAPAICSWRRLSLCINSLQCIIKQRSYIITLKIPCFSQTKFKLFQF